MIESRFYHSIQLDIVKGEGRQICYILLPSGLREDFLKWMSANEGKYPGSFVAMSGMDWNDTMTPWPADGVMKKEKPFGGHAQRFLRALKEDYFYQTEADLGIRQAERTLVGISLSGLFAIWACLQSPLVSRVACISGSLWYEGFKDWVSKLTISDGPLKIYMSLGTKEASTKDKRMSSVEACTKAIVESLKAAGLDIDYQSEFAVSHFSPIGPRLTNALDALFPAPESPQDNPAAETSQDSAA